MVPAVTREPPQGLDQFRGQLYTAWIDLEAALEDLAATADNIEKATGGPGVENITSLILDFFKTAFPTLFAAAVPIRIFDR
jgi:hypothetical protein